MESSIDRSGHHEVGGLPLARGADLDAMDPRHVHGPAGRNRDAALLHHPTAGSPPVSAKQARFQLIPRSVEESALIGAHPPKSLAPARRAAELFGSTAIAVS